MKRIPRCTCGRRRDVAEVHVVHRGTRYFTYHLCACGKEWTTVERGDHEASDVVTSGEVLGVHEFLLKEDLTMAEMLAETPK